MEGLTNPWAQRDSPDLVSHRCAWDCKGDSLHRSLPSLRINIYLAGDPRLSPGLSIQSRAKFFFKKWGHLRLSQGSRGPLDWRWRERPSSIPGASPSVSTSVVFLLLLSLRTIWVSMRKWPRSPGRKWGKLNTFPTNQNQGS